MTKKRILLIAAMAGVISYSAAADELPFGSYDYDSEMSPAALAELRDSLGFNIFVDECFLNCDTVKLAGNEGIRSVNLQVDNVSRYTKLAYAKIEAEETNSQMRLYQIGGQRTGDYWVSSDKGDVLFGPNGYIPEYSQKPQYYLRFQRKSAFDGQVIDYTAAIRLKIDRIGAVTDTVINVDVAYMTWGCGADTSYALGTITAGQFPGDNIDTTLLVQFSIPTSIIVDCGKGRQEKDGSSSGTAVKLTTTGKRTVSVDWMKVYELKGKQLVDDHMFDDKIAAGARHYTDCEDAFWGWYTNEEPYPLTMKSAGYVLQVVRDSVDTEGKWNFITANNANHANDYWLEVVPTSIIANDYYPFICGVTYAGYSVNNWLNIQRQLNNCTMNYWSGYHLAAENWGREFWAMPQTFDGIDYACWRRPTDSEFRCQTFLALASDVDGIVYWKYDNSVYANTSGWYNQGLRDTTGRKTTLWYVVKEDLNPYIKAIDDIYMGLSWDTSYAVNYQYGFRPENIGRSWIDTIYAISNTAEDNPDIGWFHVGQFYDKAGDKYIMLVNRACSQGPDNPEPAPSITATVEFKTMNLRIGNYVEIIDLATNTSSSDWVGKPDTTRTQSILGSITYTTTLDPGEGRLYKITQSRKSPDRFIRSGRSLKTSLDRQ